MPNSVAFPPQATRRRTPEAAGNGEHPAGPADHGLLAGYLRQPGKPRSEVPPCEPSRFSRRFTWPWTRRRSCAAARASRGRVNSGLPGQQLFRTHQVRKPRDDEVAELRLVGLHGSLLTDCAPTRRSEQGTGSLVDRTEFGREPWQPGAGVRDQQAEAVILSRPGTGCRCYGASGPCSISVLATFWVGRAGGSSARSVGAGRMAVGSGADDGSVFGGMPLGGAAP